MQLLSTEPETFVDHDPLQQVYQREAFSDHFSHSNPLF